MMSSRSTVANAGSLNTLMAPWGFVDAHTFITKSGAVGLVYHVGGRDYEGLDHTERRQLVQRYESALRTLDESFRVYQYLIKRAEGECQGRPLYRTSLYLVLLYEAVPMKAKKAGMSAGKALELVVADLDQARGHLSQLARGVESFLSDFRLTRLAEAEMFAFLRQLVNPQDAGVRLKYDTHLDYHMADCAVQIFVDHLTVGGQRTHVLTMKDAPASTFAVMLSDLYALPGEFLACLEWQRMDPQRARTDLSRRRTHFSGTAAMEAQFDAAEGEMTAEGHFFGECSLTFVVGGQEPERVSADLAKLLAKHDGAVVAETYNVLNAWCATIPGNHAYNFRRLALLETHAADLGFLFNVDVGADMDMAGREPLTTFISQHQTPYRYHLHVQDVGHTLVLGATGSGKTALLNWIAWRAQQYGPNTIIFDLGHGYRQLAARMGGSYMEFGLKTGVSINPFAFPLTDEHRHFLYAFCKTLIENGGGAMSTEDDRDLFKKVGDIYTLAPKERRLGVLATMLTKRSRDLLHAKWTGSAMYGRLFDNVADALSLNPFQVYELGGISEYPDVIEPLLFYILHRVNARVAPDVLTLCVMDEAWRFVTHPTLREYMRDKLKTWRKKNGTMILGTQAVEDFAADGMLRVVVESCPTQLLLANPRMHRETYAREFGLNEVQLDLLTNLKPKGQMLLHRGELSKVLDVVLPEWFVDMLTAPHVAQEEVAHV